MDKEFIIKYLGDKDTLRCCWHSELIDTSFETMPSEFINFAELDLENDFEHKYINALSNAKRALDCQADRLLKLFGFYKESQDKYWGFPKKIELIQKFEIIAPRVLNKINKTRNLMEHKYIKPKSDEVEDFLDIVSLFIASTEHFVSKSASCIEYMNEKKEEFKKYTVFEFNIDSDLSKIRITTNQLNTKEFVEIEINKNEIEFIEIYKLHLNKFEFN